MDGLQHRLARGQPPALQPGAETIDQDATGMKQGVCLIHAVQQIDPCVELRSGRQAAQRFQPVPQGQITKDIR